MGQTERVALKYIHHHMQKRELVGCCWVTQGAQPGPLRQPRGAEWGAGWEGGSRGRETWIPTADSCWGMAETNTTLQSNYLPIKRNKLKGKKKPPLTVSQLSLPSPSSAYVHCNRFLHIGELLQMQHKITCQSYDWDTEQRFLIHIKRCETNRKEQKDFPGGPVIKTPCFQCRGWKSDPWLGN